MHKIKAIILTQMLSMPKSAKTTQMTRDYITYIAEYIHFEVQSV